MNAEILLTDKSPQLREFDCNLSPLSSDFVHCNMLKCNFYVFNCNFHFFPPTIFWKEWEELSYPAVKLHSSFLFEYRVHCYRCNVRGVHAKERWYVHNIKSFKCIRQWLQHKREERCIVSGDELEKYKYIYTHIFFRNACNCFFYLF